MPSTFQRDLKKLGRHLVQIHRPSGMQAVFGFVVGSSDELVLLQTQPKMLLITALVVGGIIVAWMTCVAHQYGLWLPDTVLRSRTVARQQTPDGHHFRVVQYVDGMEWYVTALIHTPPSGKSKTHFLAVEDDFAWSVPMTVSPNLRLVTVRTGGGTHREVTW